MTVSIPGRVSLPSRPGSENHDVTVVSLHGELDRQDAPALRACLGDIRRRGQPRTIIDLTRLAFIDCACLDVLVWHACEMRARGGTVDLAGPKGAVRRILSVTGLLTGFGVHDTAGQAASADRRCRPDFAAAR
jgi:anti-sigma B factor antagonist